MKKIMVRAGLMSALFFGIQTFLYAGKVELTTYYPAPTGEYQTLSAAEDASFATTRGSVIIGTDNPTNLAVDNTLTLKPVPGAVAAQTGGIEGSLRYSSAEQGFIYNYDGNNWKDFGAGMSQINYTSVTADFTISGVGTAWQSVANLNYSNNFDAGVYQVDLYIPGASVSGGTAEYAESRILLDGVELTHGMVFAGSGSTTLYVLWIGNIAGGAHTITTEGRIPSDAAGATLVFSGEKILRVVKVD